MGYVIALAGKGGTGKTTVAALLTMAISARQHGGVLAVDADPNSTLGEALGLGVEATMGGILDEIAADPHKVPAGMSKDRFIGYRVQTAVAEGRGFDLLTMGKPEGPGCYCYVNNVLRFVMEKLIHDYACVVIDNEAGLEHLSRRTTRRADALLVVANPTVVSLRSAGRIADLADDLRIDVQKRMLIINRDDGSFTPQMLDGLDIDLAGVIPQDEKIEAASRRGASLTGLPAGSVAVSALGKLITNILP